MRNKQKKGTTRRNSFVSFINCKTEKSLIVFRLKRDPFASFLFLWGLTSDESTYMHVDDFYDFLCMSKRKRMFLGCRQSEARKM